MVSVTFGFGVIIFVPALLFEFIGLRMHLIPEGFELTYLLVADITFGLGLCGLLGEFLRSFGIDVTGVDPIFASLLKSSLARL